MAFVVLVVFVELFSTSLFSPSPSGLSGSFPPSLSGLSGSFSPSPSGSSGTFPPSPSWLGGSSSFFSSSSFGVLCRLSEGCSSPLEEPSSPISCLKKVDY